MFLAAKLRLALIVIPLRFALRLYSLKNPHFQVGYREIANRFLEFTRLAVSVIPRLSTWKLGFHVRCINTQNEIPAALPAEAHHVLSKSDTRKWHDQARHWPRALLFQSSDAPL